MKTEKQIREKIEECKEGEINNSDMGSYRLAFKYMGWKEALEWVLEDEN